MKKRLIPILLVLCVPLGAAQDSQSVEAVLPGDHWSFLDGSAVEGQADYQAFDDVFLRNPASVRWQGSPLSKGYDLDLDRLNAGGPEPAKGGLAYDELRDRVGLIRERFQASGHFETHNGPRLRAFMLMELDRVVATVDQLAELAGPLTFKDVEGLVDTRFQVVGGVWRNETLAGETGTFDLSSDSVLFASLPSQIVLRIDRKQQGVLGGAQAWRYYATVSQAIELRTVAFHVQKLFSEFQVPAWSETHARLKDINVAWDNYLDKGFSQFPWESLLNSYAVHYTWDGPPKAQWVLLHPEPGLILDTRSQRSASYQTALLVHGLGYIRYFGNDRSWFAGLSATASLTDNAAFGTGLGATLHFGHTKVSSKIPHLSLGVLWHDFERGGHEPVLSLGMDLGTFISDSGEDVFRSRLGVRFPKVPAR